MGIGNALRSRFGTRLLITALVAVATGLLIGLGIRFALAQGEDGTLSDCELGGDTSFVEAHSISELASRADAVIKGKVTGVRGDQDQYAEGPPSRVPYVQRFMVYDIALEEVLSGSVPQGKSQVSLGVPFTLCLDIGATYYMFVENQNVTSEPYVDRKSTYQVPADYSLAWFGPANVMELRSGKVVFLGKVGQRTPGSAMDEAEFRELVRQTVSQP